MKPTQEQVIAWAEEAGFYPGELRAGFNLFMGLASLAHEAGRKDENEACAKVCDAYDVAEDVCSSDTAEGIALAIRARREQ